MKGKGVGLSGRLEGLPVPPLTLPLRVQLQADNGTCFEATYRTFGQNGNGKFKAKND